MRQVFIIGSSSVYGVGATSGGWADLLKQYFHSTMYSEGGIGEEYEVYNFGKSGATIEFVLNSFSNQISEYGRDDEIVTIISVGGDNSKAEGTPDNYVSTIEEYSKQMVELLDLAKEKSAQVIVVGSGCIDELKTNPKANPLTGGVSYFTNSRRKKFEAVLRKLCEERGVVFCGVEASESEWNRKYLYVDGLHPNQAGHEFIARAVLKILS